ncbi:MAG TPA: hypothetical protein VMW79_06140 [Anaerolineae bacterium]|nr:hypothetical protein [Anaerolineae bacterium]HUW95986.1 hypothetical protein [Anaerolineae bacterium]
MDKRKKYRAPAERRSHEKRYRALVDFSIRDDKGGWLNVKAGEEFTPPARMNVRQHVELSEVEEAKSEVIDNG